MKFKHNVIKTATAAISSAALLSVFTLVWAGAGVAVDFSSNTMATTTSVTSDEVYVRIAGPNGYFKELREVDIAYWVPDADTPDGVYQYDSYSIKKTGNDEITENDITHYDKQETLRKSGSFVVRGGLIELKKLNIPEQNDEALLNRPSNFFQKVLISTLDLFMSTANANQLLTSDASPAVVYRDTSFGGNSDDWVTYVIEQGINEGDYILVDRMGANNHGVVIVEGQGGNDRNRNSIRVDLNGNVGLVDNLLYLSSFSNRMGLGTTSPQGSLHIMDSSSPEIALQQTGSPYRWEFETSGNTANINVNDIRVFRLEQGADARALVIDRSSNIGIATDSPTSLLHLKKDGAELTVEDLSVGAHNVVQLKNKGNVGFELTDTTSGANNAWAFRTGGGGSFLVSQIGTPGPMISLASSGSVSMGHNSASGSTASNLVLSATGNLIIPNGAVTATTFVTSSSRSLKTDFSKVDASNVLNKIKNLDVTEWRYSDKNVKGRHIGPMAEDFYALFNLGPDNKHVAATDMASIAIIAAKELQAKNVVLAEKMLALESKNNNLQARLESLEKLVTNLASSGVTLSKQGEKFAQK